MSEKKFNEIVTDIVVLEQNLTALHANYIQQREVLVAPLRDTYEKQKRKLERKRNELKSILKDNVVGAVMGDQQQVDDQLYGWSNVQEGK